MEETANPCGDSVRDRFRYAMTEGEAACLATTAAGILVGYSGGADSAALLTLCAEYGAVRGIPVAAVHVHHGIRGASADADAAACRSFCAARRIPLHVEYRDVPGYAAECGMGLEEAARRLRYEVFSSELQAHPGYVLAIAHSADDNLETVLFHMVRGTGLGGMCGIPPVRGRIIRPLLHSSAADIRAFCETEGIPFVQDDSNLDTKYTRNYIRAAVTPALRRVSPAPEAAVSRMCRLLRRDAEYLDAEAERALASSTDDGRIAAERLAPLHDAILSRICARLYENACGSRRDLTEEHIREMMRLIRRGGTWSLSLPGGICGGVRDGYLEFFRAAERTQSPKDSATEFFYPLTEGEHAFPEYGFGVRFGRGKPNINDPLQNIYKLSICTPLSFATIQGQVFLRFRENGDTIRFGGMTRRVKKLLNAAAMPAEQRARLPFFCDEAGILWIPGFPVRDSDASGGESAYFVYYTV